MELGQLTFDKTSRQFTVTLLNRTFVGAYRSNMSVRELLDTISAVLNVRGINSENLCLLLGAEYSPASVITKLGKILGKKGGFYELGYSLLLTLFDNRQQSAPSENFYFPIAMPVKKIMDLIIVKYGISSDAINVQFNGNEENWSAFFGNFANKSYCDYLNSEANSSDLNLTISIPRISPEQAGEDLTELNQHKEQELGFEERFKDTLETKKGRSEKRKEACPSAPPLDKSLSSSEISVKSVSTQVGASRSGPVCQTCCETRCQTYCETRCQACCETRCQTRCETCCETRCQACCETRCQTCCETCCETST